MTEYADGDEFVVAEYARLRAERDQALSDRDRLLEAIEEHERAFYPPQNQHGIPIPNPHGKLYDTAAAIRGKS
jgi:hypothetical protein